ncbi:hypothetical protein ACFM35_00080 [Microbacterium sp. P01]|uniref:hypothetical protein n=1 Tax=Microbacterium sp. P01 TaxID=3366261 RepID=UPI00366C8AAE
MFDFVPVGVQVADGEDDGPAATPIRPGAPLSIRIVSVFPGDEEHQRGRSALLTSAVRSPMVSDATPLAMHYLYENVAYGSLLSSRADQPGSDVVYYSPGELSDDLEVTMRLAFDRFDKRTFDSWVDAAATAAGLPVFAVSGPTGAAWVAVAKTAAKLVSRVVDGAIDGNNDRVMTWRINLNTPGQTLTKSGYVLLYPDGNTLTPADVSDGGFQKDGDQFVVRDRKLYWRDRPGEQVLEGDSYVLLYINGAEIPKLEGWAAAAVSAALTETFLNASSGGAGDALEAFSLFNDVRWLREIGDIETDIADLKNAPDSAASQTEIAKLEARRAAAQKNIQDKTVSDLYRAKTASTRA